MVHYESLNDGLSYNHTERQAAAAGRHRHVCASPPHPTPPPPRRLEIGRIDFLATGGGAQWYILMNESNLTLPLEARCGYALTRKMRIMEFLFFSDKRLIKAFFCKEIIV